jgi:hypothetical protein
LGHKGIKGNEIADALAKQGTGNYTIGQNPIASIPLSTKSIFKNWAEKEMGLSIWFQPLQKNYPCFQKEKPIEFLEMSRDKLRIIIAIYTGYCRIRLNHHLHNLQLEGSFLCRFCKTNRDTSEHILCQCEPL